MNIGAVVRDNLNLIIIAAVVFLTLFLSSDYLFITIFGASIEVVCMPLHR